MPLDFNWDAAKVLWDVLQALALVGVAAYTWWQRRERVARSEIDALRESLRLARSEIDGRLHAIDRAIDGRPQFSHFDSLQKELADSNRTMSELSARLAATASLLDRLHDYLLTERKAAV